MDYFSIQANTIIKGLNRRNMAGYYVENRQQALQKVLELINKEQSIGMGGSETVKEIGLVDILRNEGYNFIDREKGQTREQREDLMRQCLLSDTFLMSSNAVTLDGQLVNIDGNSNRVAALCFGPRQVIIVVGKNKVVADVESAIKRIRTMACVPNAQRLNLKTPCALTGKCNECLEGTMCAQEVITRYSREKDRIKVIIVGEELGY